MPRATHCPIQKGTMGQDWRNLVAQTGEDNAWRDWTAYNGFPTTFAPEAELRKAMKIPESFDLSKARSVEDSVRAYNKRNDTSHTIRHEWHPKHQNRRRAVLSINYLPWSAIGLENLMRRAYNDPTLSYVPKEFAFYEQKDRPPLTPKQPSLFDDDPQFVRRFPKVLTSEQESSRRAITHISKSMQARMGVWHSFVSPEKARELTKGKWDGEAGFAINGNVFFVDEHISESDQIHEFAHPLVRSLRLNNPAAFQALWEQFQYHEEGLQIEDAVKLLYPEDFEGDIPTPKAIEEMLVRAITFEADKIRQGKKTSFSAVVEKILDYILDVFHSLYGKNKKSVEKLHPTKTTLKDIADLMVDENTETDLHLERFPLFKDELVDADEPSFKKAIEVAYSIAKTAMLASHKENKEEQDLRADAWLKDRKDYLEGSHGIGKSLKSINYANAAKVFDDDDYKTPRQHIDSVSEALNFWQHQYFKNGHIANSAYEAKHHFMDMLSQEKWIPTRFGAGQTEAKMLHASPMNARLIADEYKKYEKAHALLEKIIIDHPTQQSLQLLKMDALLRMITRLEAYGELNSAFVLKKLRAVYVTKWMANRIKAENTPNNIRTIRERGSIATEYFYDAWRMKTDEPGERIILPDGDPKSGFLFGFGDEFTSQTFLTTSGLQLINLLIMEKLNKSRSKMRYAEMVMNRLNQGLQDTKADLLDTIVEIEGLDGKLGEYFINRFLPKEQFDLANIQQSLDYINNLLQSPNLTPDQIDDFEKKEARFEYLKEKRLFYDDMVSSAKRVPTILVQVGKYSRDHGIFDELPVGSTNSERRSYALYRKQFDGIIKDIIANKKSDPAAFHDLQMLALKTYLEAHVSFVKNQNYGNFGYNSIRAYSVPQEQADVVSVLKRAGVKGAFLAEADTEYHLDRIYLDYKQPDGSITQLTFGTIKKLLREQLKNGHFKHASFLYKLGKYRFEANKIAARAHASEYRTSTDAKGNVIIAPNDTPPNGAKFTKSMYRSDNINAMLINYYDGLFFKNLIEPDIPLMQSIRDDYYTGRYAGNAASRLTSKSDLMPIFRDLAARMINHRVMGHSRTHDHGYNAGLFWDTVQKLAIWSKLAWNYNSAFINVTVGQSMLMNERSPWVYPELIGKTVEAMAKGDKRWYQNFYRLMMVLNNTDIINVKEHTHLAVEGKLRSILNRIFFIFTIATETINQMPWIMLNLDLDVLDDYDTNGILIPGKKGISVETKMNMERDISRTSGGYSENSKGMHTFTDTGQKRSTLRGWQIGFQRYFFGKRREYRGYIEEGLVWADLRATQQFVEQAIDFAKNGAQGKMGTDKTIEPHARDAVRKTLTILVTTIAAGLLLVRFAKNNDDDDDDENIKLAQRMVDSMYEFINVDKDFGWFATLTVTTGIWGYIAEWIHALSLTAGLTNDERMRNSIYGLGRKTIPYKKDKWGNTDGVLPTILEGSDYEHNLDIPAEEYDPEDDRRMIYRYGQSKQPEAYARVAPVAKIFMQYLKWDTKKDLEQLDIQLGIDRELRRIRVAEKAEEDELHKANP